MFFGRLSCLFNRHRPVREHVGWNGFHYTSQCRHCSRPIRRLTQGGWREVSDESGEPQGGLG